MTTEADVKPVHMTDAEWEALNDADTGPSPDDGAIVDDDDGGDAAAAAAAAVAATEAEAASADEAAAATQPPLLVAAAPADADALLAELATQKEDLATQFDDGELSAKDYRAQLDALDKQERKIELDLHTAKIAADMDAQQKRNAFLQEVSAFTKDTAYTKSTLAWGALDAAVRAVGADPANAALTGRQILEKAHAEMLKDPVLAAAFTAQPAAKAEAKPPKTAIPPTLGKVPAAEMEDTGGNRFAGLERLLETDPMAYEKAVGKLSPAELDAFLSR